MKKQVCRLFAIALAAVAVLSSPVALPATAAEAGYDYYSYYDDYLEVDDFRTSSTTKTSITLKWRKTYLASGYEIQVLKPGSKAKWTKVTTVKKGSKTSYKVKKLKAGTAYRFRIRAYRNLKSGKKDRGEWEKETFTTKSNSKKSVSATSAKSIALKHAGLTESQIWDYECELDYEYGTKVYEISFQSGMYEYEYEIDASNGKILFYDKEWDD